MDDLGGEWQAEDIAGAKVLSLGMSLMCSRNSKEATMYNSQA